MSVSIVYYIRHTARVWTVSRVSNGQVVASMNGRRFHSKAQAQGLVKNRVGKVGFDGHKLVFLQGAPALWDRNLSLNA